MSRLLVRVGVSVLFSFGSVFITSGPSLSQDECFGTLHLKRYSRPCIDLFGTSSHALRGTQPTGRENHFALDYRYEGEASTPD